jgi:protein JSN1
MLEYVAPHLAAIGIHKNGTWAAQKIIECITTPEQVRRCHGMKRYATMVLIVIYT